MSGIKVPDGIIGNKFGTVRTASGNVEYTDLDLVSCNPTIADITLTLNNTASASMVSGRAFTIHNESLVYKVIVIADDTTVIGYVLPNSLAIFKCTQDNPTTYTHWKNLGLAIGGNQSDIYNLGITYAAGVFTVTDANGNALSETNYGTILMPSVTAGQQKILKITAGGSFNDDAHASSSLTNYEWGRAAGADWASDCPFFLYIVNKGDTGIDGADGSSAFFISDIPNITVTPAAANSIGDTGAIPVTDDQGGIIIMDNVTVADYVSLPCKLIGCFRMRYATGTHDWTVQALSAATDGIGDRALQGCFLSDWVLPVGQNGAEAGKHFTSTDGATALTFAPTNVAVYNIRRDGTFICDHYHDSQSANGADGTAVRWSLPYKVSSGTYRLSHGQLKVNNVQSTTSIQAVSGQRYATGLYINSGTQGSIDDNVFANTDDYVWFSITGLLAKL